MKAPSWFNACMLFLAGVALFIVLFIWTLDRQHKQIQKARAERAERLQQTTP